MKGMSHFLMLVLLVCSCSLFKRTTTNTEKDNLKFQKQSKGKTVEDLTKTNNFQYLTFSRDSVQSAYRIQLWPKGRLIFKGPEGFEGEFDSVLMTGYLQKLNAGSEILNVNTHENKSKVADLKEDILMKAEDEKQVKQTIPDYYWIISCLLIVFTGGFLLFKQFKF